MKHQVPQSVVLFGGTNAQMTLDRVWVKESGIYIYSLNLMGQAKLNREMAKLLYQQMQERNIKCDVLVTVEAKAIGLAEELTNLMGHDAYVVLRKSVKAYMKKAYSTEVHSITTTHKQDLYLDDSDAKVLKSAQHLVFLDDVISTGASFNAANTLLKEGAGKEFTVCVCAATEGKAQEDNPNGYVRAGHLPLYNAEGELI